MEVLDGSRVHPETYEWARKMAIDALEYDETADDANPAGALEEILENPERLRELDLDAFAEELDRQVRLHFPWLTPKLFEYLYQETYVISITDLRRNILKIKWLLWISYPNQLKDLFDIYNLDQFVTIIA